MEERPTKKRKTNDLQKQSTLSFTKLPRKRLSPSPPSLVWESHEQKGLEVLADVNSACEFSDIVRRIRSHDGLTTYRKRLYTALLSVPSGRFTTYAAFAKYLGSSARAVGSGIRNNPFAPDVPCHRVLASDRTLGGFGGSWGGVGVGKNAEKKLSLLKVEGVKFDSTGKAKGPVFEAFTEFTEAGAEADNEQEH